MERLKLAALGERLKTGGERLKIGGAQISRTISEKMKDMLQGQTQESKMVDEATSNNLAEPNWGLNLRICALLNGDELSGPEVVRVIKKKVASTNTLSQCLSLDLLEACALNCDKVFSAIASEKVLDEMVRMIDNPQTHYTNRQKAMQLIRSWGESDDLGYLPVFHQTYMSLKARGIPFGIQEDANLEPLHSLMDSGADQQPLSFPEEYPNSNMDQHGMDQQNLAYHGVPLSMEEKKEFLVITRNCMELLSSMLNSESQQKPVKDDLTMSILEKCKQSQPIIQRIIETAGDGEEMLFDALNLNDELLNVLSKYEETEVVVPSEGETPDCSGTSSSSSVPITDEKEAEKLNPSAGDSSETSSGCKING